MQLINRLISLIKDKFYKKDKNVTIDFNVSVFKNFKYLNIKPSIRNFDTVFIFFIKKNIDVLLNNIISKLEIICRSIVIGIEIEFYINDLNNNEKIYKNIKEFCYKNKINILDIDVEKGKNQYEIKFNKYTDIYKLISDYNLLKDYLIKNFNANFSTCNEDKEPFSALQLNINIFDQHNKNLFARCVNEYGNKNESNMILYSINGILQMVNFLLPLYIKDRNCMIRFDYEINKEIYKNGNIPAPTFISWGVNNRTAAIRIPTPVNFEHYEQIDNDSRRIEFRVPSSEADIKFCIFGVLSSMLYGIENKIDVYKKNNYNILTHNNSLEKIELKRFELSNKYLYDFLKIICAD